MSDPFRLPPSPQAGKPRKGEDLALMPFLQIYIPERFSEIQRLGGSQEPHPRPILGA
jgi:hypothetical protein